MPGQRRESYVSGSGRVESFLKNRTDNHDEIVVRLKDGRRLVISNNTRLGVRIEPSEGDTVGFNGFKVNGTNVVHKVHPNKRQRGGWIELSKSASNKITSKYSLKENPTYDDVAKVFKQLSFEDRANVTPKHPDFIREVPADMLFDRQVVVDEEGNPVGFNEFYAGKDKLGRRQPPHNAIAVIPEARGNGISRLMVEAAVRKARKERIKRLVWEAFSDNDPSIRAALSAGFEDRTPKNAKGYRRFVYNIGG